MLWARSSSPDLDRTFGDWDCLAPRHAWFLHERSDQGRRTIARLKPAVLVKKLTPPTEKIFQDFVELRAARNQHHAPVEFVGRAESFRIPRRRLAKHPAAELLAEYFHHELQMAAHHAHPLLESWLWRQFTRIQVLPRVPEDPGIVERATPDAHSGAAGLRKHHFRRCRTDHIAIAD